MAQVLIIAEQGFARRMAWVLEDAGHHARVASTAAHGLREATAAPPDVILLNDVAPAGERASYAARLKDAAERVPVIDVSHNRLAGADAYLRQPFDADQLLAQVDRVLRDKRWAT